MKLKSSQVKIGNESWDNESFSNKSVNLKKMNHTLTNKIFCLDWTKKEASLDSPNRERGGEEGVGGENITDLNLTKLFIISKFQNFVSRQTVFPLTVFFFKDKIPPNRAYEYSFFFKLVIFKLFDSHFIHFGIEFKLFLKNNLY